MIYAECIQQYRDANNQICGYRLVDSFGGVRDVSPSIIKTAIREGILEITNLKLLSDSRLVYLGDKDIQLVEVIGRVQEGIRRVYKYIDLKALTHMLETAGILANRTKRPIIFSWGNLHIAPHPCPWSSNVPYALKLGNEIPMKPMESLIGGLYVTSACGKCQLYMDDTGLSVFDNGGSALGNVTGGVVCHIDTAGVSATMGYTGGGGFQKGFFFNTEALYDAPSYRKDTDYPVSRVPLKPDDKVVINEYSWRKVVSQADFDYFHTFYWHRYAELEHCEDLPDHVKDLGRGNDVSLQEQMFLRGVYAANFLAENVVTAEILRETLRTFDTIKQKFYEYCNAQAK